MDSMDEEAQVNPRILNLFQRRTNQFPVGDGGGWSTSGGAFLVDIISCERACERGL